VNANAWQDVRARGDEWTTCATDRPVLCQFASHDPEVLVKVVKEVQHEVDGVDLNLGCPQGIARRGRYGSWLQDEWQLIYDMVSSVAQQCSVPITVKIRVFDDHDRTLQVQTLCLRSPWLVSINHFVHLHELTGHISIILFIIITHFRRLLTHALVFSTPR
jgi:tRNA-dihydrouridine synthase